ncbi:unnamed protein product [Mesocestoides corti]|nr:unnamed protein product [Mesocestoides corti]
MVTELFKLEKQLGQSEIFAVCAVVVVVFDVVVAKTFLVARWFVGLFPLDGIWGESGPAFPINTSDAPSHHTYRMDWLNSCKECQLG